MSRAPPRDDGTFGMRVIILNVPAGALLGLLTGLY